MIDHQDNQTQPLPLDEQPAKRGRGRPGTGQALSNAERQRLYRERQKTQRNEKPATGPSWEDVRALTNKIDELSADLIRAMQRAELAEARADAMGNELAVTKAKLGRAMERRSSTLGQSMQRLVDDMHEVAEAVEGGSTWRIQKKTPRGKWKTQAGAYWQLAKAEDALLDLPKSEGALWRIIEVQSEVED